MISFFVNRPITTIMFISFFIVLGIVGYLRLPIENNPKIDFPVLTIKTIYPGATSEEIETKIIKQIEETVMEVSQIKKVTSYAYENFALIIVEFQLGSDINIKSIEVKDKVEAIIRDLPEKMEKPIIEKFDPLNAPVSELVLNSKKHNPLELYEYVDTKLKKIFFEIKGVSQVEIYGGKKRQINIELDPNMMNYYYLTINDVISRLTKQNINIPAGNIEKNDWSFSIRFEGEFTNIEEIKSLYISSRDATQIKLSDIAIVTDGHKKIERIARFNGQEVVALSIKKTSEGNLVQIGNEIKNKVSQIQEKLPEGMKLTIATDNSNFIVNETNDTLLNILIGILLTIIVLYIFTGNIRITFIASIVIPTSIISAFFLVDYFQFSINMITLLAIATSLGTLIANAIVIIENVIAHIEKGKEANIATIDGTKEVASTVIAATGTNLVVFTPIAFMGGIVGQFMKPFGFTVVFATVFSLLASFSLTPMLCSLLLKKRKNISDNHKHTDKQNVLLRFTTTMLNFCINELHIIFTFIFRYPKACFFTIIIFLIFIFSLIKYIGNEFMPSYDENALAIIVKSPQGSTIEKTSEVVKRIENELSKIKEIDSFLTSIGENGSENAKINLNLIPHQNRTKSDFDILNFLLPKINIFPDTKIHIVRGGGLKGDEGDVTINLYGEEYNKIIDNVKKIISIMENSGYFRSIKSSYQEPKDQITFLPKQKLLNSFDLDNAHLASVLRLSVYGDESNRFKGNDNNNEEYKMNISLLDHYSNDLNTLKNITILSNKGLIPLNYLVDIKKEKSSPNIIRRNNKRIIQIDGYLSKSTSGQVISHLEKQIKEITFPLNYGYEFAGNAEHQEESTREIIKAFILASILTYMVLAAIMNSLLHPFTIATSIITSFSGVFLFLFLLDYSINIASMLAMVMLVGLVVNNSIIMLEHTFIKLKEENDTLEALWLGIKEKFRAIIMTSMAIIFGTLPQLTSIMETKASMGAVIIGGMSASIIITFTLVPLIFYFLSPKRNLKQN